MNRIAQGVIALAAAVVLCLGGAGSMAFWQGTASTTPASFTMGGMSLAQKDAGAWTKNGSALPVGYRAVPGDVLTYTQQFDLTMTGDGLIADVSVEPGAVTISAGSGFVLTGVDIAGTGVTGPAAGPRRASASTVVRVTFTFTWDKGTTIDNSSQNATISIATSVLRATQVSS